MEPGKSEPEAYKRILADIGRRLVLLRLRKGYKSYETFALDHELSRMHYWRMENGKSNMTVKSLLRVLAIYNMSIEEFFREGL